MRIRDRVGHADDIRLVTFIYSHLNTIVTKHVFAPFPHLLVLAYETGTGILDK
jgi:hypothetical protein